MLEKIDKRNFKKTWIGFIIVSAVAAIGSAVVLYMNFAPRIAALETKANAIRGMSEKMLDHLFEPFTQENRDDNSERRGSGLGLAIVKHLVDVMDGTISVESAIGKGTTFLICFELDRISIAEVHDMRTPLNGIIGFTNLALQSDDDHIRRKYLEKAGDAENLLLNLINDSLEFTRAESGKTEVYEEQVDTRELIESVRVPISEQANAKGVEFRIDTFGCTPGVVIIDKIKIEKILLNLLSNAVKFTPAGGHDARSW